MEISERVYSFYREEDQIKIHRFDICHFNGKSNFKACQMDYKVILISLDQIDVLDKKLNLKEISCASVESSMNLKLEEIIR